MFGAKKIKMADYQIMKIFVDILAILPQFIPVR